MTRRARDREAERSSPSASLADNVIVFDVSSFVLTLCAAATGATFGGTTTIASAVAVRQRPAGAVVTQSLGVDGQRVRAGVGGVAVVDQPVGVGQRRVDLRQARGDLHRRGPVAGDLQHADAAEHGRVDRQRAVIDLELELDVIAGGVDIADRDAGDRRVGVLHRRDRPGRQQIHRRVVDRVDRDRDRLRARRLAGRRTAGIDAVVGVAAIARPGRRSRPGRCNPDPAYRSARRRRPSGRRARAARRSRRADRASRGLDIGDQRGQVDRQRVVLVDAHARRARLRRVVDRSDRDRHRLGARDLRPVTRRARAVVRIAAIDRPGS